MAAPNYPNSFFDFPPWGSGIQSGYTVQPYHIQYPYWEISGVELIIGLNPLNGFPSLTERISGIESGYWNLGQEVVLSPLFIRNIGGVAVLSGQIATSIQDGFLSAVDRTSFNSRVFRAGDTITGGLTVLDNLSGLRLFDSGIRPVGFIINGGSGNTLIANKSDNVYNLKGIVAGTNISIVTTPTDITINSTASAAGTSITTPNPTTNSGLVIFSGITGAGFLNTNWTIDGASTLTEPGSGNLRLGFNGGIVPTTSGNSYVGLTENRLSGLFVNNINSSVVTAKKYNEVPNGLINGSNKVYTYTFVPYNNSLQTYVNGLRQVPSGVGSTVIDYVLSGVTQTFLSALPSGSSIISDYSYIT